MSSVFGTKETSSALKDIVSSMKDAAANMELIIKELSRISNSDRIANILKEAEVFLKNINETVSTDDLKRLDTILLNLESFSVDLKDITGDGKLKDSIISTLDETRYTFEKSNTVISTLSKIKLLTSADFSYKMMTDESYLTYLLNFDFHLNKTYLNLGFGNYFKYDRLINMTINSPFNNNLLVNYGVIKSKPGLGVTHLLKYLPVAYSLSVYDFEDPFYDFGFNYLINKDFKLSTGINEFNKDSKSVYLGFGFLP